MKAAGIYLALLLLSKTRLISDQETRKYYSVSLGKEKLFFNKRVRDTFRQRTVLFMSSFERVWDFNPLLSDVMCGCDVTFTYELSN